MEKEQLLKELEEILNKLEEIKSLLCKDFKKSLEFEDNNFKVNSDGWKKITVDGKIYLENPKKDIWEFLEGEAKGEQLFTWEAAMRETKKAGKRIPTDEEFSDLLKTKSDMPNLVLAGHRYTTGSFADISSYAFFWSSLQSGANAWFRILYSDSATVARNTYDETYGFSVRCLKN